MKQNNFGIKEYDFRLAAEMDSKISADERSLENISLANRPMKVSEEYSLLTSNVWLDAKNELDEVYGPEREANKVQVLADMLLVKKMLYSPRFCT